MSSTSPEVLIPLNPLANQAPKKSSKNLKRQSIYFLTRRIHILNWLPHYDREKAAADLIAGITLGLTIIPQSIAYAALAGIPSEYGLYSAFIGSIIYVFFGTIPQVSIGPTSLMSLLVSQYCHDKPVQFVIVLAFLAGLVELLMGLFELGFIVNFIPSSVTKAFTSSISFIVASVQIKNLFGIKKKGFIWPKEFWNSIQWLDASVGFICLIILLFLKQLPTISFCKDNKENRRIQRFLWYISISRNALVVFISGFLVYFCWYYFCLLDDNVLSINLSAHVTSAWPKISWPPFIFTVEGHFYNFAEVISGLGSSVLVVPFVAVLGNVAIAKVFTKNNRLDASQEMFTLGLCNIVGSFFSAMPTSGAFTRSAVSEASGVRTPMAGLYTGVIVLLALSILTPYFRYIPKSTLAAVLIVAVLFMIDLTPMQKLWRSSKKDFIAWAGCLVVCVCAGVEVGLLYGILFNMLFVLFGIANPKIEVTLENCNGIQFIWIRPTTDVFYSGVEKIQTSVRKAVLKYGNTFPVVIDCSHFRLFDATFIDMLTAIAKDLSGQGDNSPRNLLILQLMPGNLKQRQQLLDYNDNLRFSQNSFPTENDFR